MAKKFWSINKALRAFDSLEDCPTFIRNLVQAWHGYKLVINRNGAKDAKESDKLKVTS